MCAKFYEPFKSISLVMANVCNSMLLQQKNIRIRFYNITCWLRLGRSFISLMTYCLWLWVDRTSHASPKLPDPRNFTFSYRFLFISAHFTIKFTFSKIKLVMKFNFGFRSVKWSSLWSRSCRWLFCCQIWELFLKISELYLKFWFF